MSIRDEALEGRIRSALAQDKRLSGLPIVARVSASEVHLKGKVDTEEQKDLTIMVVQGVPGVRGVISDELEIREGGE